MMLRYYRKPSSVSTALPRYVRGNVCTCVCTYVRMYVCMYVHRVVLCCCFVLTVMSYSINPNTKTSSLFRILYSVLLDWYFFHSILKYSDLSIFLLIYRIISYWLPFRSYLILPYTVSCYSSFLSPFRMVIKTLYAAALIHVAQGVWMLGSRCNLNSHIRCYSRLHHPFLFTSFISHFISILYLF